MLENCQVRPKFNTCYLRNVRIKKYCFLCFDCIFEQTFIMNRQRIISPSELLKGRVFALMLLLLELVVMFAYGFAGFLRNDPTPTILIDYSGVMLLYTFAAMLAILGYGLLIAYSDNSAIAGLTTTLIVVAISVQLTPLLLQFWSSVFNGFGPSIEISLQTERITMALCTSLLASLTSLVGRLGKIQTLLIVFLYNIGWTLSYVVTQYIQVNNSPSAPSVYDDYGTNYVYVFAGVFALITSLFLNCKKGRASPTGSRHSAFIALIGTGFVFACFPFTGILFNSTAASNIYRRTQGPLNIYFALTASVICTYISSAIFGKGKIGVRESLIGVLSGGVTIAVVAGTINNIGACIAIGAFSGLFSGFWLRVIHPRLNATSSVDHLGIFGPVLMCSIFGGLVLAPALYQSYNSLGTLPSSMDSQVFDVNVMSYQLANIGIAAGTALCTAILAGLLSFCFRNPNNDFEFTKLVSNDYGLYSEQGQRYVEEPHPNNDTNTHIKNDQAL